MKEYEELVKALRCEVDCGDCAYWKDNRCDEWGMRCDAADALEAAEKRIAELSLDCEMYQQKCMEMGSQLPKQGKWISDLPNELFVNVNPWKCSVCGKHQHFREDYCPNCGAKMKTVTDCHTLEERER